MQNMRANVYKNAISNDLYAILAASLHNRIHGDTGHLDRAKSAWDWLYALGMVNADHLFFDGLAKNDVCFNNNGSVWTYHQGVILGAATGICLLPPSSCSFLI